MKHACYRNLEDNKNKISLIIGKPTQWLLGYKEMKVGEKGDLIPPVCLVATPTSYIFGEASHTDYEPLTTALQPWKEPFSLDALLFSNGQDTGRDERREGGCSLKSKRAGFLYSCVGGSELRGPVFFSISQRQSRKNVQF